MKYLIALLMLTGVFLSPGHAQVQHHAHSKSENTVNWDSVFTAQGLMDVQEADSSILVNLRYSSKNNFIGKDVYGSLENAYLRPLALRKLVKASALLKERNPALRILIYDGTRPRRIQQILWDTVDLPAEEKPMYVANPASGSIHNYGFAVDLTLADTAGNELDMGTDYDDFSEKAHTDQEEKLVEEGILTRNQVKNRQLLRAVMTEAGFIPLRTEWWHFDALSRREVTGNYQIVE